jgi:hypothetical protein
VGGKEAPTPAEIHKNGAKKGRFPAHTHLKITENLFFIQKYLLRYTPKILFYFKKLNISSYVFVITAFAEVLLYDIAP